MKNGDLRLLYFVYHWPFKSALNAQHCINRFLKTLGICPWICFLSTYGNTLKLTYGEKWNWYNFQSNVFEFLANKTVFLFWTLLPFRQVSGSGRRRLRPVGGSSDQWLHFGVVTLWVFTWLQCCDTVGGVTCIWPIKNLTKQFVPKIFATGTSGGVNQSGKLSNPGGPWKLLLKWSWRLLVILNFSHCCPIFLRLQTTCVIRDKDAGRIFDQMCSELASDILQNL